MDLKPKEQVTEFLHYKPSKEITAIIKHDERRNEVSRRARLRDFIHEHCVDKKYTMRTERLGGEYIKNQLDAGYPEWESLQRAFRLMKNRIVND